MGGVVKGEAGNRNRGLLLMNINHSIEPFGVTNFMRQKVDPNELWMGTAWCFVSERERPRSHAVAFDIGESSIQTQASWGNVIGATFQIGMTLETDGLWSDEVNPPARDNESDALQLSDARKATWRAMLFLGQHVRR